MFSKSKPLPIVARVKTPRTPRQTAPSPPRMLVPPTTAAAIAASSRPVPRSACADDVRDADRTPSRKKTLLGGGAQRRGLFVVKSPTTHFTPPSRGPGRIQRPNQRLGPPF